MELIVKQAEAALNFDALYQTDMAESLKAMALEGHGLAFLPASSVTKELRAHTLAPAAPQGQFELAMELRIYRERPALSRLKQACCAGTVGFFGGADDLPPSFHEIMWSLHDAYKPESALPVSLWSASTFPR